MYGGTRAHDYQIVEADQYRGVQVWGLYHVGADFSIVGNTSEHCERQWNATALGSLSRSLSGHLIYSLPCWSVGRGEGEKTRRREEWKEWEGRGQEGGVWGGWVRGLSESLSESQITRIKGFRGLGGRAYGKREIGDPSLQLLNRDREVDPTEVGCPTTMKQSRNGKLYRDWIPHPISHMALRWSAQTDIVRFY